MRWRVIGISRGANLDIVETSLTLSYVKSNSDKIEIIVSDGEHKRKYVGRCSEDFDKLSRECNPYGVVSGRFAKHFFEIDDMSWKFLDLVENVELVIDNRDGSLFPLSDIKEYNRFVHLDDCQSLFSCLPVGLTGTACGCTLFQGACCGGVWQSDKMYLLNRFVPSGRGERRAVYCVTFTDVEKAKVLISKAAFIGYNPIEDFRVFHTWG